MTSKSSPIFTRTYDFLLWCLNHCDHYPKSERFRLSRRLEEGLFDFYELLMESARAADARSGLMRADLLLDKVRFYVRLCHARKLMDDRQYEFAVNSMLEIGRLLGGWLKSLPAPAVLPGEAGISAAGRLVEQQ